VKETLSLRAPLRRASAAFVCATLLISTALTHAATNPLTILGHPASSIAAGSAYSFTPTVTDTRTGRKLTFVVAKKPAWATFSSTTGKLSGTPSAANVGKYSNIVIAVYDGIGSAMLFFAITVTRSTSVVKISGTPATNVVAGSAYSFKPTASDSAGKALAFSVMNKPSWATFSISTGQISGTASTQVGTYANIIIKASDGTNSASLAPFNISVTSPTATGKATLSWTIPTTNTDGSTLTNYAGVRIYYGPSASSLTQLVQVAGATVTSYSVSSLKAGTWYFAARSYSTTGAESGLSSVVSKMIN
jgi:hypothetical protein